MHHNSITIYLINLAVLFFSSCSLDAQERQMRDVGEFTRIELGVPGEMFVRLGNRHEVVIEAKEDILNDIDTKVRGEELIIELDRNWSWNFGNKDIKIFVTLQKLNGLAISGSGNIEVENAVRTDVLYLKITGSGKISGEFECRDMETIISGSGSLNVSGKADAHDVKISGSGDLNATNLVVKSYNIKVSGSGGCEIHAEDELYAQISGSGTISYKGQPDRLDVQSSGSGSVRKM